MAFSKNYFQTFTVTTANPAVFTLTDHGFYEGDELRFETSNTLPTGLELLTDYWVIYNGITVDTFQVSAIKGGTAVEVTGTGSGTHKLIKRNRAELQAFNEDNE